MNRREFTKTLGTVLAGSVLSHKLTAAVEAARQAALEAQKRLTKV
jgi:hypothetical protein